VLGPVFWLSLALASDSILSDSILSVTYFATFGLRHLVPSFKAKSTLKLLPLSGLWSPFV
jgi:hypothetical protein